MPSPRFVLFALLCALCLPPAGARTYVTAIPELLAESPAADWRRVPDEDLVLLELASGTVIIELLPFAPARTAQWRADPATTAGGIWYYAAIGNPARELDGRLPVMGHVIEGFDAMTALPHGGGAYGFFEEGAYVPILRTRVVADLPAAERPRFERLRTASATFATLLELRAAALGKGAPASTHYPVDACSVPLPVRRIGADA